MTTSTPTPEQIEAILNGPALPPPDGVKPDFENPPNNNGLGYGLLTMMLAIGTIAILLRLLGKGFKTRKLRIEDGEYHQHNALGSLSNSRWQAWVLLRLYISPSRSFMPLGLCSQSQTDTFRSISRLRL